MKITSVKTILLKWPCALMSDALSVCTARQALLVKIETDTQLYGIGEAFCYGSPLTVGKEIIEKQLAPILIGKNPEDIEKLWQTMYWRTVANGRRGVVMAAISGIDIALWDLLGKAAKLPVSKLLGSFSDKVPTYASGGFYAPGKGLGELRRELEGYAQKGYRAMKIKIGRNPGMMDNSLRYMENQEFGVTYEEDMMRLALAREIIGDGKLAADINAAWTAEQVLKAYPDFLRCRLDWLEEPIQFEDVNGCQKIVEKMPEISLMGFETEQGAKNFQHLLDNKMVDIVQPDIGWGGGVSELMKIGAQAYAAGKSMSLHSFGSAVHFAASLHVAAACANTECMESEENENALKTRILKEPFEHDQDMNFYVPQKPGLGIELDWEKIEHYVS
ncbi:MAG: mandelate racemase/muconate lactonizing enzyme family protein [Lachnospiraceae bacterium]